MAGRAAQVHVDRRAAVAVHVTQRRALRAGQVAVAPLAQGDQHRLQVEALLGQPVLVRGPRARLPVRLAAQHALLDQHGQPVGQHLAGDAGAHAACRRSGGCR